MYMIFDKCKELRRMPVALMRTRTVFNHNKWLWKRKQQMVAAVALTLGFDVPALLHYKFRYKPKIEKLQVPRWQLSCQSLDILFLRIACCRVASKWKDVLHPMCLCLILGDAAE